MTNTAIILLGFALAGSILAALSPWKSHPPPVQEKTLVEFQTQTTKDRKKAQDEAILAEFQIQAEKGREMIRKEAFDERNAARTALSRAMNLTK